MRIIILGLLLAACGRPAKVNDQSDKFDSVIAKMAHQRNSSNDRQVAASMQRSNDLALQKLDERVTRLEQKQSQAEFTNGMRQH